MTSKMSAVAQMGLLSEPLFLVACIIEDNVRDNQLKIIKYNHLIALLLIFHYCHTIMYALKELEAEGMQLTPELLGGCRCQVLCG